MKIPSNKQWTQDNSGENFSVLSASQHMSFDTKGKAQLANKPVAVFTSDDDVDLGRPLACSYYNNKYIVLTDDDIFQGDAPAYAFTAIASTPATGLNSDAVVFNSLYTVSTDTSIYTWDASSWTNRSVTLTTSIQHPLEVFGTQLAVGNGNTIKLLNTSYATAQTLTLPTSQRVISIRTVNDFMYIGTQNINGGNAMIYVWDGDSALYNYAIEVGANWVFSLTPYMSTVAFITSEGQLGYVNGTGTGTLGGLPVYYDSHARWQDASGLLLNGKVFSRGMCTIGDNIYMNIDGSVESGFIPEMKSGIWVYDPEVGLYHKASASGDRLVIDDSLALASNTLTTSVAHKLKTGDAVVFATLDALEGVDTNKSYFVKVISATEIKIAGSRKSLQNGEYVTLSGTPGGLDKLAYCQNSDYHNYQATSGFVTPTVHLESPYKHMASEILWGNSSDGVDGSATYGVYSFSDTYNIGFIKTQRIYTDNTKQNWQNLYQFIDGLIVDTEEVVVRLNNKDEKTDIFDGIWATTSELRNSDTKDRSIWSDIDVGDEVVVVDGYGRGQSANVIDVQTTATTITATLDNSIGTDGQTCDFYRTPFKKIGGTLTNDNKDMGTLKSSISEIVKSSPWVDIKIELRGFSPVINVLDLENTVNSKG